MAGKALRRLRDYFESKSRWYAFRCGQCGADTTGPPLREPGQLVSFCRHCRQWTTSQRYEVASPQGR